MGEEEKRPGSGTAAPGIPKKMILYAGVAVVVVILAIAIAVQMDLLTNLPVPASGSASIARPVAAAVNTIAPAIVRTTVPNPPELRCPSGLTRCGSGCIDTRGDIFNCGGLREGLPGHTRAQTGPVPEAPAVLSVRIVTGRPFLTVTGLLPTGARSTLPATGATAGPVATPVPKGIPASLLPAGSP